MLCLASASLQAKDVGRGDLGKCSITEVEQILKGALELRAHPKTDSVSAVLKWAIKCSKELNRNDLEAKSLFELGIIEFRKVGPRDTPTRLFLESLALYTEIGDQDGIADCNLQLGVLNFDIRNFEAAVGYFKNILNTSTKNQKARALANYLTALCYSELGLFKQAEEMFDLASSQVEKTDSIFHLQILAFKGKMYSNKGEPEKGITLLQSLLGDYKSIIVAEDFAPVYAFLATAYLQLKDYKNTIIYGRKAYGLSIGRGSNTIYLREAEAALHKAFSAVGLMDSAYYYLQALSILEDSVTNDHVLQRVAEMSGQYEFQQKLKTQQAEQELKDSLAAKEIEKQKLLLNITLIGLLFMGAFAVIFFKQRINISRERDRSENLLLNILPEEIAQELKEKGKADARDFGKVSILFTDFKGFTKKSASLTASDLVNEINHCFEAFDHIAEKYQIEKIKTIGDAYMAAGGLPVPTEDSVKNTVLAALEMQSFITNRIKEMAAEGKQTFQMRAGIHTGPVVAGIVGVKKFQYDIWGDTVNTASRMESSGDVGKVNISQTTYNLLKDEPDLVFESRGKIKAKGKGEMEMWFVSQR